MKNETWEGFNIHDLYISEIEEATFESDELSIKGIRPTLNTDINIFSEHSKFLGDNKLHLIG